MSTRVGLTSIPTTFLLLMSLSLLSASAEDPKSQAKKGAANEAEELLKIPARPKKEPLPASKLPLELRRHERLALVGNTTAERFNLFGHFETRLHQRFPERELVVRNFARPADEVGLRQRPSDYTRLGDPLLAFNPDTIFCFFGFNESFAGPQGIEHYKANYEKLLEEYTRSYPRDDAGSPPRFVLVSPIAFEASGQPNHQDAQQVNANLRLYAQATAEVAAQRNLAYVDLFEGSAAAFAKDPGLQFTVNSIHLNEVGDKLISQLLDDALFCSSGKPNTNDTDFEKLRAAINDKSWVHQQDYRMVNGWYVYGGRRTWDTQTFPKEFVKIRKMAEVRDRYVWSIAQGKSVPAEPDDSDTGELYVPPTRFGQVRKSEADDPRILSPDEFIKTCSVPPGFEVKLFADEKQFPNLAKPVQLNFDNKGRLWVATMPTYPMWKPGDPKPNDKLLILSDTDADGRADKCTVFYDQLHCPTGFEFFDGGVLVVDQPRILFLKDTDGDDRADIIIHLLDGWATEDTHHTINAWEYSHGGYLNLLEGVSMSTAIETPWGPIRNFGTSGSYVLDPRTFKVRHFSTPGYGNPWCYVYNEWGQGFCGDATTANQHWDTLLSGAQFLGRKGINPVFNTEGLRPVVGSEFLVTRHFPKDVQGQFTMACVINTNGMPRWNFSNDGAGYKGTRIRHNSKDPNNTFDLIKSSDKHFRPVDPMLGPDGALWFGDWANPIIGHMQYSQRDPNRDTKAGRIYRLINRDQPLVQPVTQHGKTIAELLEQFREYEWRTRYRVRTELRARPADQVVAAVEKWILTLDAKDPEFDRLRCEALWVMQGHHAIDQKLLIEVATCKTPDARAAAVRMAADEREYLSESFEILRAASVDPHPRVQAEALRGLSFYSTLDSSKAIIAGIQSSPADSSVRYLGEAALTANLAIWQDSKSRTELSAGNSQVEKLLNSIVAQEKRGQNALINLQVLLGQERKSEEERNKAMQSLADLAGGNPDLGKAVFRRNCTGCHQVYGEGAEYGPPMDGNPDGRGAVGKRLSKIKIIESIIDPSAEISDKYLTTQLELTNGRTVSGLVVEETRAGFKTFLTG